jgi:hypothetical protein
VIGVVLALIVVGLVLSLVGLWIFSIPVGIVALILFALFVAGWGRAAARTPDAPG